jgi:serpin B
MLKRLSILALLTVAACAHTDPVTATSTASASGDVTFAARLYGRLRGRSGNVFFSPTSARMALAMAYGGARGETSMALRKALALPDGVAAHEEMAASVERWDRLSRATTLQGDPAPPLFHVANRVWLQRGFRIEHDFETLVFERYRAPLGQLDMTGNASASAGEINQWVARETEGKVSAIITPADLHNAMLALTNAVYFKGSWWHPFNESHTLPARFEGAGPTLLMSQQGTLRYAKIARGQLLELPYGSGELVLDVALPDKGTRLDVLERRLVNGELADWLAGLHDELVLVFLPKFHAESKLDLAPPLIELGAALAFDPKRADFSGICGSGSGGEGLFIGLLQQVAVVDVDERGTEAAAATAVVPVPKAAMRPENPPKPIIFRADHPFLYFIRDRETGVVLFAGRLVQPTLYR